MAKIKIPTVNEKLLQRYIRHAVYLEQLKTGEAKLISRFLKTKIFPQIYKKLIDELGRVKNLSTLGSINKIPAARLKRMLAATQKISTAGMVKAEKMLVNRLVNISKFEADWNKNIIEKTVPVDIDMAMPSSEVLRNLVTMRPMDGHKLGTWMKGYSTAVRVAMTKQIKVGIATGEALPAIGRRINKALGWKGKQAEYIARTAVSNVVHQAKEEVFKKNTDIVRKVQWISTLDDRTSMICINYDGKIFDVGHGERPPAHFNCRSTVVPITPSWQEFGISDPPAATRASMNGAVPAKMTYKKWLKTQPKAVQVKVLGKKRAELYRSGQVKIDKFVGKNMKPLTLKQIARREGLDLRPAPPRIAEAQPITVSKVGTTFAKETTKEFQDVVSKQLDVYPEKVKAALNNNGTSYNITDKLTNASPKYKNLRPAGWSKGATFDSVEALYDIDTKSIIMSETYKPVGKKVFAITTKDRIIGGLNHETGHAFNHSSVTKMVYSNQHKFKTAYAKDISKLSESDKLKNRFFLQSGARGRDETFAEIFANKMGKGAIKRDIRELFPNSTKYIDDLLKAETAPIVRKAAASKTRTSATASIVDKKIVSALKRSDKATAKIYTPVDDGFKTYEKALRLTSPEAKLMMNRVGKSKEQIYADIIRNREISLKAVSTKEKYFGANVEKAVTLKRIKLHDKLLQDILSKVKPSANPKALMTGGLPGAGKSSVLDARFKGWKSEYVHVDSDSIKLMLAKADGLKTLGPNAAAYHEEADLILGRVFAMAIKEKKSILYDGTMRNSSRINNLMSEFKRAGYNTTAVYADLPLEKSMVRSIGRAYGDTGRFVDPMMQTTHGTKNIDTFNMLKEKVDDWVHYDTDVVFGEQPILIESK